MLQRILGSLAVLMAMLLLVSGPLGAGDKAGTHDGIVVKAADGKLTMTDKAGKNEHTHIVAATAKIACDGKACKLEDLQKGYEVRVTTEKQGDRIEATRIDAKKKV